MSVPLGDDLRKGLGALVHAMRTAVGGKVG